MDSRTSLHAFGDIVGYSRLNAAQQAESQERFARILDASLLDAGVRPDSVSKQDQGDARLLTFPDATDVARVLAVMPRRFSDELKARNRDSAAHARLRVRLSYVLGPAAAGTTGQAGNATIAVVRLSNAALFRQAMKAVPEAYLGVIVDDYLYRQYIQQAYRPDLSPEEYLSAHVSDREKDFDAEAWIRLIGYPPGQWEAQAHALLSSADGETGTPEARRRAEAVQPVPLVHGAQAADYRAGRRGFLTDPASRIIAAAVAGVLALVGVVFTVLNTGNPSSSQPPTPGGTAQPTQHAGPTSSASVALQSHGGSTAEYADWRGGVQVYADNQGTASNMSPIPFDQRVEVSCAAPNDSAMTSINKFYKIGSGPWKGTYASANEFTNGGPRGGAGDPETDRRVPACPAS
jgi:hypothetical protein